MKTFNFTLVVLALSLSRLPAATYTLAPLSTDYSAELGPVYVDNINGTNARVGTTGVGGGNGRNAFFAFGYPKVPFGDQISGASFSANMSSSIGGTNLIYNGDLYSLGVSTSSAGLTNYYYNGAYNGETNSTGLQPAFVTNTSAAGRISATSTGNGNIASDMNQYRATTAINPGQYYYLMRISPSFAGVPSTNYVGYNFSLTGDTLANQPALTVTTSPQPQMGRVLYEYWSGVTGTYVSSLTGTTAYQHDQPSSREYPTVCEIPPNLGQNAGDRMQCFFYPSQTGTYTFALASSDNSVLYFNTDGTTSPLHQVAQITSPTGYQQWGVAFSEYTVALTQGQKCFIQLVHKVGATDASNCSLGWMPPGATQITLMPATSCAPYDASAGYTSGAIASVITQQHPRLMLSPASLARLKAAIAVPNSTQANWWASIQSQCTTYLSDPVIALPSPIPSGFTLIGDARQLQDRIYYLSLYYNLTTDTNVQANCLNRIYAELQSASNWGGSNADATPWMSGKWDKYQGLDLPEVSHPYAIAYDWCYAGWSAAQRSFIVDSISRLSLAESDGGDGLNGGASKLNYNWFTGAGNWPMVCNGGAIVSALAILGDEATYLPGSQNPSDTAQAPTILDTLMPTILNSTAMAEWGPDGGWPESEDYFNFATRYLATLFASLETSSASCFKLDQVDGMSSMGSFEVYEDGPLNRLFDFGDEGGDGVWGVDDFQQVSMALQYLGLKYNQPVYSWRQQQNIIIEGNHSPTQPPYPTDLLWYDPRGDASLTTANSPSSLGLPVSTYFGSQSSPKTGAGIILLRSVSNSPSPSGANAWTDKNGLYAGMKAGYNENVLPFGSGHSDLELGSFVFDALGVRWAYDIGEDSYGVAGYFDENPWDTTNRWQYYRTRAEGNNTLVITPSLDGGQSVNGVAQITNFKSNASTQQAIIDMTSAYATTDGNPSNKVSSSTPVTSAKRGLRFINGVAQLQDEVTASSAVDMNWFMHTQTTITLSNGNKTATLTPSSGTSRLQMTIQSPSTATFAVMNAVPLSTSPNPTGQNAQSPVNNTGITKLWIDLPSTTSTTLTVSMAPYIQGSTPPASPAQTSLSNW